MTDAPAAAPAMSRQKTLEALSGLMLGMLTTILSTTVVGTSLPVIVNDLGGTQATYTWVVTSSLLAMTVSTPLWGKLADLFDRKLLVQVALGVFVVGSVFAGMSQTGWHLIAMRALQGLGAGGLMSLSMVLISDIISPRERGRYVGLLGGVMSIGTVGGPLLGGVITDGLGWRWTFYVCVPLAALALVVLQRTLHLPAMARRAVRIDYLGALLISAGIGGLLVWVSLAGHNFAWASPQTAVLVSGSVLLLVAAVAVEARVAEPIIPLALFRNRTLTLSVIASVSVGVAMFGTSVFLAQYMQIARDKTPTQSGLLTIPMVLGSFAASAIIGQLVSRTGRYKWFMVGGGVLLTAGTALMATIDHQTSFVLLSVYMAVIGVGMGACMQNLVLITQNTVDVRQMGVATATVTFFRSLGGAMGVAALGAVLSNRVTTLITDGLGRLGIHAGAEGTAVPKPSALPAPVRDVVEQAYGQGIADLFLAAVPLGIVATLAMLALKEQPLGTRSGIEQRAADGDAAPAGRPVDAVRPVPAAEPA
jgi:EmrB/QacA subfamily drug resistance transporter